MTASTGNNYIWAFSRDNSPPSVDGTVFGLLSADGSSSRFNYTYMPYAFNLGVPVAASWNYGAPFTPEEVWNIDTKIDDGVAGSGIVLGPVTAACSNTTTETDFAAQYNLLNTSKVCWMSFNPNRQ